MKRTYFTEDFIKSYNENGNVICILEVSINYPEQFGMSHNELPLLPGRMKTIEQERLIFDLNDKEKYVVFILKILNKL